MVFESMVFKSWTIWNFINILFAFFAVSKCSKIDIILWCVQIVNWIGYFFVYAEFEAFLTHFHQQFGGPSICQWLHSLGKTFLKSIDCSTDVLLLLINLSFRCVIIWDSKGKPNIWWKNLLICMFWSLSKWLRRKFSWQLSTSCLWPWRYHDF